MDAPVPRDELTSLAAFAVVADERSFTKAARKLGLSRSAISHSILTLEERLGVRLLARTTRSVAPTETGQDLLAHLQPALNDIRTSLAELGRRRAKPAGTVRLIAPPMEFLPASVPCGPRSTSTRSRSISSSSEDDRVGMNTSSI